MKYTAQQEKDLLKIINSPSYLHPKFRRTLIDLVMATGQQRLPFYTYETYRTPQRQNKLISEGFSKLKDPYDSKHVHGLAADFLIINRVVTARNKNKLINMVSKGDVNSNPDIGKSPLIYNIGVNVIGTETKKARTVVEDRLVLEWWQKFGLLIERQFPDLIWGGNKDIEEGQLIGSDPAHVEYRHANKLIRNRETIPVLRASGNPGLL